MKNKAKTAKKKKPVTKVVAKPSAREGLRRPAAKVNASFGYNAFKAGQADLSRERSSKGRDIWEPNPEDGFLLGYKDAEIANSDRRERCGDSLRLFCETYNPAAFSLAWSDDQLRAVGRIEEAVTHGALYAFAEPRGNGKTTRIRMAAIWAMAYGLTRYVFVIGATDKKASDTLDAMKMFFRFSPEFASDFPEISYPIQRLEGIANRSRGQMCNGSPTLIEWTGDSVVLPSIRPPRRWPKRWPLRSDGLVPTSGSLVSTSGLTGEGIRGSLRSLTTGEQVRPDFVLLDDPQTPESSRSRTQNAVREQLVSADVLGMAGPGRSISAVMPCTIITPNDCIDRLTDRAKHPMWRGERTRMLRSMPRNMAAWDGYFEVYRRCTMREPPDYAEANSYYREHQTVLDTGADASWVERFKPDEVSAIQSAMHLFFRDRRAFMSEYQNDPDPIDLGQLDDLDAGDIAKKVNGLQRYTAPRTATHLAVGIDVQAKILFYTVVAWSPGFGGAVIDYGTFPDQRRSYFAASEARPSLEDVFRDNRFDETARIFAGLRTLLPQVVGREYPREGGGEMRVGRCLIDSGKWDQTIREACRQSPFAALLLPSKGYGIGAGGAPMANWQHKPGERRASDGGQNWIERANTEGGRGRLLLIDTNYWKSFVARRLQTPEMGAGCLQLWGDAKTDHQLYADHLTAEYRVQTVGRGRKVEEWKLRPERPDNHWWDTLVYAAVAANALGVTFSASVAAGEKPEERKPRVKVKLSEVFAKKHGGGVRV